MKTSRKQLPSMTRHMLMTLFLLMTAGSTLAQKMQVTYEPAQEEPSKWRNTFWHSAMDLTIVDWNDDEFVVYSFDRRLYLARFDRAFDIKASSTTKVGHNNQYDDEVIKVWTDADSICAVIREENDLYLYSFDRNSLEQKSVREIFKVHTSSVIPTITPVDVGWSENGEYVAVVARHLPKEAGLRDIKIFHEFSLFDKHFNLIGSGVFDSIEEFERMPGSGYSYASSWTITDDGELLFASLKAARKPKKYPEFGPSATQMEIGRFKDNKMTTFTVLNVGRGKLPLGTFNDVANIMDRETPEAVSMSLRAGSIFGYDGKSMMLFFVNTLYKYSFEDNTVTLLTTMQFALEPRLYSSGLSRVIEDDEDGHIVLGPGGFVWVRKDVTQSYVGNWGERLKVLQLKGIGVTNTITFFHKGRLYHVSAVNKRRFIFSSKSPYLPSRLLSVDKDRNLEMCELEATGGCEFYRASDSRVAFWERDIKMDGKKCQRFGFVDLP